MRLLFVNQKLSYASTSSYTLDLALALRKGGDEVQICTMGGDLRKVFLGAGIETYLVKFNLFSFSKLLDFLREYAPDLIHIQNRQSALFGQKISRKLRVPQVTTVHRVPDSPFPRPSHPFLAGIIAVSEVIREALVNNQRLPKGLIRVIPHGVNVDLLVPERDRKTSGAAGDLIPVVGSVGRLTRVKGHHVFLRAARSVLDMGIEAMFAIVGEGEEEKSLRGLVKDLRLQYNVTFSPHIPNRPELYRVFDIVVVPTLRGGMGSTALEAMSMGKPVIASKVGEILHIIQDGKTGLLVPEGDADVLARRISELISHPALSKALGNEARAYVVDNFSLAPMVKSTREFYAEALSMFSGKGLRKEDFSSAGGSR